MGWDTSRRRRIDLPPNRKRPIDPAWCVAWGLRVEEDYSKEWLLFCIFGFLLLVTLLLVISFII